MRICLHICHGNIIICFLRLIESENILPTNIIYFRVFMVVMCVTLLCMVETEM